MNIYPWATLMGDASLGEKSLAVIAIILCVMFALWLYHHQKGNNLTREINEPANKTKKIPQRKNSNIGSPDTASAPLNKADIISSVTYPEKRNDTMNLAIQDAHTNIGEIVSSEEEASQL